MALDVVFFLAPDDKAAAATHQQGPGRAFESVTCHSVEPDTAIAEWDLFFEEPSPDIPPTDLLHRWAWPAYVTPPTNDGVEVFALPQRLIQALAVADPTNLARLADRWATRLTWIDGDDMTGDDLLAIVQGVARLATSAVSTGGSLYSWSF